VRIRIQNGGGCSVFAVAFHRLAWLLVIFHWMLVTTSAADTHFVSLSGNHVPPFTNWISAATNIQSAIDIATPGDLVLVSNGVYQTGGRVMAGSMTNRVVIDKAITVQSVNGPAVTTIRGNRIPVVFNGNAAVRCVWMTNGATLAGFTLTNGATRTSGTIATESSGGGVWAQSTNAVVSNCVITGNSADQNGGGAYSCTLYHCTLTGNKAGNTSGGAQQSILNHCTLSGNSANFGGGSYLCTLNDCTLTGNSAAFGGGAADSGILNNCTLTGNSATLWGGGTFLSTLNNSDLAGNSAGAEGGGTYDSTLNNCTLTGNSAQNGGGASLSDLNNCIVYFNVAFTNANFFDSTISYTCTTPMPAGPGNITANPLLATASQLSLNSPCIGAGISSNVSGADIDGEPWGTPPSMGCDEIYAGGLTGVLSAAINVSFTNIVPGFPVNFSALIIGRPTGSSWHMGDGVSTSNQPYITHAYSTAGIYTVTLRTWNSTHPAGVTAAVTVVVDTPRTLYVNLANATPAAPFTNWIFAATSIQAAVDAAYPGETVLVSNGVYQSGGRVVPGSTLTNRVVIDKPLMVRSVNGAAVTVIRGARDPFTTNGNRAIRCVWLAAGANLVGFTLTNGATRIAGDLFTEQQGGGVWAESITAVISNCFITGNSANERGGGAKDGTLSYCTLTGNRSTGTSGRGGGAGFFDKSGVLNHCVLIGNSANGSGGGVMSGTLNHCLLIGNSARFDGGGTFASTLYNCVLTGNSANEGGGTSGGELNNCTLAANTAHNHSGGADGGKLINCIVYFNTAITNGPNYTGSQIDYTCTTPLPAGDGNLSSEPQFVNLLTGDLRLQVSSPCIDQGINQSWMFETTDLDGNTRIINSTVDIGAYELVFEADLKAMLQGPYDTNTHLMSYPADVPTNAPYAADARSVVSIPSNSIDWVHVELRTDTNSAVVFARSAFLRNDGVLVSENGEPPVKLEAGTGTYYIVVHHRNHLSTMTAHPLAFTNRQITCDFTASAEINYGESNAVIQVETNIWALIAGDADGDGEILPVDELIWRTQKEE